MYMHTIICVSNVTLPIDLFTITKLYAEYRITLLVTGVGVPILLSLLRFVPCSEAFSSRFNAVLIDPPLLGHRHKTPIAGLFHLPTRGQSLFIAYLVTINIVFCFSGIPPPRPNAHYSTATGSDGQVYNCLANRFGVLSFANIPLLILYAGRNSVLLWLTQWSHGTFLLMHRWVAWIATFQAVLHSLMYLHIHVHDNAHELSTKMPYWRWGAVAVICLSLLLPSSMLLIRRRIYELFLAWHVLLSIFVVVGCYWHIVDRFSHQWGYENWIYVAIAVWGFERGMRYLRIIRNGIRTAHISIIDDDYIRIDIPGMSGSGHAYLYFPTLTWRFWENHPFSIASAQLKTASHQPNPIRSEKSTTNNSSSSNSIIKTITPSPIGLSFLVRSSLGMTGHLRSRVRLPVLVESDYGPHLDLTSYPVLLCFAGGVGITGCMPYLTAHIGVTKLFWGSRSQALVDEMSDALRGVDCQFYVEQRMNIHDILTEQLAHTNIAAAVMVCGPSVMADAVRLAVCQLQTGADIKLIEEAFSW